MDNFNLQGYMASGKLHATSETLTEAKKQGYDDREDESLGARKGAEKDKKQSMKDRRDDSYGKFGKRDAEKKGKNKINKEGVVKENEEEELELDADYDKGGKYYSEEGAEAFRIQPFKLNDIEYTKDQAMKQGKYIVGLEGEELKKFISDYIAAWEADKGDTESGKTFKEDLEEDARTDAEQEGYKDGFEDAKDDIEDALKKMKVSELKDKIKTEIISNLSEAEEVKEALDMTASPETLRKMIFQLLDDGRIQPETADDLLNAISNSPSKNIYEEEEVDVDIDVEDEVEVDAEADDIEIERKGVKAKVEVGLSPEEEIVQDSLKAAMDAAQALGSDKLADQIGNTITFFTRQFVVGDNTD